MKVFVLIIFYLCFINKNITRGSALLADILANVQYIKSDFHQILIIADSTPEVYPLEDSQFFIGWISKPISLQILPMSNDSPNLSTLVLVSFTKMADLEEALLQMIELERWNFVYLMLAPATSDNAALNDIVNNFIDYIPLHSAVYWVFEQVSTERNDNLEIWETYSIKGISFFKPFISLKISDPLFSPHFTRNTWKHRKDFNGAVVTATAVIDPDYLDEVNIFKSEDGNLTMIDGFAVEIFRIFRDEFNFTENLVEGDYILETKDPQIPGMEHHLINGTADISITVSTASEAKAALVRMLHVTIADWVEARFAKTSTNSVRFFRMPFGWKIWLLIAFQTLTFAFIFRGFHCVLFRKVIIYSYERSLFIALLWSLGFYGFPSSRPLRLLFFMASISGYLLNISYSAMMTAQLSVKERTVATLETLMDWRYKFFLEEDVPFPIDLQEFPRWMDIEVVDVGSDESLQRAGKEMATTPSALVSFPEYFNAAMKRQNVSDQDASSMFEVIRVSNMPNLCSMTVSKSSPFKDIFNIKTLEISGYGILIRLKRKYKADSKLRYSNQRDLIPQTVPELALAYYILLGGALMAVIALLIERVAGCTVLWTYLPKSLCITD